MLEKLQKDLLKVATPEKAKASSWFFKTGKGQYGYGDKFLGVTVPEQRIIAKRYEALGLLDLQKLLQSEFHEERLTSLFIIVGQFEKGDERTKEKIYKFYLKNAKYINNWDLVDASAHKIVGEYLLSSRAERSDLKIASSPSTPGNDIGVLEKLAHSKNIWERRIAIIATAAFIGKGEFETTFKIAEILLQDKHDLLQKAVGWMLREVGKRVSKKELEKFLKTYYKTMPRTTLRYAIEHFPPEVRQKYLKGKIENN